MKTRIALVGIGGYGLFYLRELLQSRPERNVELVAGIDPYAERSPLFEDIKRAHIPLFPDLESFYQHETADLVILSVPIHLHARLTCLALAYGSHVLCEKPLGASLADARQMMDAEAQSGKRTAIGYQWSFSDAVLSLKRDILAGRFGRPLHFKTLLLWTRAHSYYRRNTWAGRIRSAEGDWVLDSPVNNATAHYLHNMLFVLGRSLETSTRPAALQAELYRANPIENYDAAALRVLTEDQVDLLFLTAHPVLEEQGPQIRYEFEDAVIEYTAADREFRAHFNNGMVERYGSPENTVYNKLWQTVEAIQSGKPIVCGLQTALPHLVCVLGAQETPIRDFSKEKVKIQPTENDQITWVEGLSAGFLACYELGQLPSETGEAPWAHPAASVDLQKYASILQAPL